MKTHKFKVPARRGNIYRRYFKWTITSPLWLPAIFLLIGLFLDRAEVDLWREIPEWILIVPFFIAFSLVYGGIPYAITLLLIWKRIDFENSESWMDRVLMLPLIFTPIQLVGVFLLAIGTGNNTGAIPALLFFGAFDLVIGYGYVLVWVIGFQIIRWFTGNRQEVLI